MTEVRSTLAEIRAALSTARDLLTVVRRERHSEARDIARPIERDPRAERPRCGARCRDGHACSAPVVWVAGEAAPRRRCRLHGGLSTGPRTEAGRSRALANLRRGTASPVASECSSAPSSGAMRFATVDGCADCRAAERRVRHAATWFARRCRERGGSATPEDFERVVRWTRCEVHARAIVGAWERAGRPPFVLELSCPIA